MRAELDRDPTADASGQLTASIVIPVRDGIVLTRACLDALRRQALADAEILVVDDGSRPENSAALAAYAREVRLVSRERSEGFAAACNAGAALARGRYLILLNNDTLPLAGWLDALVTYAESNPQAAIVGARLLWPDATVQHAGVVVDGDGHLRHLYAGLPADHPAASRSRRVRMVTGAAMLVRREAWETLGGLDASYVNGYEDIDLCLRAGALGLEVHVCGGAALLHLESATRGRAPRREAANLARLRERWGRLAPDDIARYAEDGLVRVAYDEGDLRIEVSPELGRPASIGPNDTEALLSRRSRECFGLRQQNLELRAVAADPWSVPAAARRPGRLAISVVIPLSDHGSLSEVLRALSEQTLGTDDFEVLVANPGHVLDRDVVDSLANPDGLRLRSLDSDPTGGRAAAWNRAIEAAVEEVVVFLADDFVPVPGFLAAHLTAHREDPRHQIVAVGPGLFPDRLRISPFIRWLEDSGELFGVSFRRMVGEPPPGFFFGGNASAKREFLREAGPADERFSREAWDDYELGLRLRARGMEVRYLPAAMALHEHRITLGGRRKVIGIAGEAAAALDAIYPAPHPWNTGTDPRSGPGLAGTAWAWGRHVLRRRAEDHGAYYQRTLRRSFLRGYRRGDR